MKKKNGIRDVTRAFILKEYLFVIFCVIFFEQKKQSMRPRRFIEIIFSENVQVGLKNNCPLY